MSSITSSTGDTSTAYWLRQLAARGQADTTTSSSATSSSGTDVLSALVGDGGDTTTEQSAATANSAVTDRFSTDTGYALMAAQEDMTTDLFTELDSDGDGALSAGELSALADDDDTAASAGGEELLEALDSDGDGSVDEAELAAMAPPPPPPPTAETAETGETAETADETADGSTGTAETESAGTAGGGGTQSFDPLDTNQDGVVTPAERMAGQGGQFTPTTGNLSASTLGDLLRTQTAA